MGKAETLWTVEERAGELVTIPLSMLVPSASANVRKTGGLSIVELAASIDAQGVLQNLIVIEQCDKLGQATGRYEVAAGGRRLRALRLLAAEKKIARDEPILCRLVATLEQAKLASLAENSGREALHPADEFDAMNELVDGGLTVQQVAARFGVSVLTVQRRLKLARVAPALVEAFRKNEATLEQLMALAISDDQDAQLRAWAAAVSFDRDPRSLRRILLGQEIDGRTHPVAVFVTVEAYEQAGGAVRRDLFSDEGGACYLTDWELVRRLANERLQEHAQAVAAEGWAWVEVRLAAGFEATYAYRHASMVSRAPTQAEQGELDALQEKLDAVQSQYDELDEEASEGEAAEKLQEEMETLDEALGRLRQSLAEWPAQVKAIAGALVGLNQAGEVKVHRGLIRGEDRKQSREVAAKAAGGARRAAAAKAKPVHSEALMRALTAQRTLAVQAVLADSVPMALVALAHALVQPLMLEERSRPADLGLQIQVASQWWKVRAAGGAEIEGARAWQELRARASQWAQRLPEDGNALFDALLALPQAELLDLLALCAALSVNAIRDTEGASAVDAIARACSLDMTQWWKPTRVTYFDAVSKARIANVLQQANPAIPLKTSEAMKKDDLAQLAEQKMADSGWLPEPLRAPA